MFYTHTQIHIHHGVVAVWLPVFQVMVAVCKWCELTVIDPCCNLRLEKGWPSYGWRRVGLLNSIRFIGRAKTEGKNSYRGVWYMFYGK